MLRRLLVPAVSRGIDRSCLLLAHANCHRPIRAPVVRSTTSTPSVPPPNAPPQVPILHPPISGLYLAVSMSKRKGPRSITSVTASCIVLGTSSFAGSSAGGRFLCTNTRIASVLVLRPPVSLWPISTPVTPGCWRRSSSTDSSRSRIRFCALEIHRVPPSVIRYSPDAVLGAQICANPVQRARP